MQRKCDKVLLWTLLFARRGPMSGLALQLCVQDLGWCRSSFSSRPSNCLLMADLLPSKRWIGLGKVDLP